MKGGDKTRGYGTGDEKDINTRVTQNEHDNERTTERGSGREREKERDRTV